MAAMSLLKNLPDGYCLNPSDEQIISYYLARKIQGISDQDVNFVIPEIDIYKYEPQDLIPLYNKMGSINSNGLECFFFCTLGKDPNRRCKNRKIAGGKKGFWHQTGVGRKPENTDQRRWAKLIFCHRLGTHRDSEQTDWVMHEFRFIDDERFVLCRITKKPKKKLSVSAGKASAGKKRKVDSTSSESHQEESIESCILNDINTKKAKRRTRPSQNDNHTPLAASSEASVHVNAPEVPTIMNPFSNIVTLDDFDRPLISSHHNYHSDMTASESMFGGYAPPQDINALELLTVMSPPYDPETLWCADLISSHINPHSDMSPSVSTIGAHPPPIDINPPELPTIMTPLYELETLLSYDLISTHHNYHFDMFPIESMIGGYPPPLDINALELPTIMNPSYEPEPLWSYDLISSHDNLHFDMFPIESMIGGYPPPLDINALELPTIMNPSYEPEPLWSYDLISSHDNLHFDMFPIESMIGGYPPPLDVSDDGNSMDDNLFPLDVNLVY